MNIGGGWQFAFSNWVIDATISGSILVLLALLTDRLLSNAAAIKRNFLWRLVTIGLSLSVIAAALPRLPLGLIPATSAFQWVQQAKPQPPDFHEFASGTQGDGMASLAPREGDSGRWVQGEGWLCLAWLAGFLFALGRLCSDTGKVRMLARQAQPIGVPQKEPALGEALVAPSRKPVQILRAKCDITPMSWGWRHPKILLPKVSDHWSEERRDLVLRHEWGHILQNDFPYLLLNRVMAAVFWFNPLVWVASKRLARAREQACDDYVLGTGIEASTYADHLLDIARAMRHGPKVGQASLSMARLSELEGRLMAVLDRHLPRGGHKGNHGRGWSIIGLILMFPLFAVTPWKPKAVSVIDRADLARLEALSLSAEDWHVLEQHGVTASFLTRLVDFGYRHLDVTQILAMRHAGIEESHLDRQTDLVFQPLQLVTDRSRICMRADEIVKQQNLAVEIEGKTYYALPRCSLLMHRPGFRLAVDPISGRKVDKAGAVIGATAEGHVFYFENERNFKDFNSRK